MNKTAFNKIKKEYDGFYAQLMKKGRLPMWSTEKGFWNAAITDEVYEAFKKIKLDKFKSFLDIGSGDGKIVLIASLFCKNAEGVEIDDILHFKALEMQNKLKLNNVRLHNKDFLQHDFGKYDVLFLNPDTPLERGIESKLLDEMKGTLIHFGHHFHPRTLRKEDSFLVDGTLVSLYSK